MQATGAVLAVAGDLLIILTAALQPSTIQLGLP